VASIQVAPRRVDKWRRVALANSLQLCMTRQRAVAGWREVAAYRRRLRWCGREVTHKTKRWRARERFAQWRETTRIRRRLREQVKIE
jgi:hypothetical protein